VPRSFRAGRGELHRQLSATLAALGRNRRLASPKKRLLFNSRSYKSVAAILKNGTDRTAPPPEEVPILFHANILGRSYYN
jgi:hypothetical protein